MTLDEAIKREEEMADCCEYDATKLDLQDRYENYLAGEYGKTAEECRQRAEWFRELKRLRKQDRALDKVRDEIEELEVIDSKYSFEGHDWASIMKKDTLDIIDKYRKGEE